MSIIAPNMQMVKSPGDFRNFLTRIVAGLRRILRMGGFWWWVNARFCVMQDGNNGYAEGRGDVARRAWPRFVVEDKEPANRLLEARTRSVLLPKRLCAAPCHQAGLSGPAGV